MPILFFLTFLIFGAGTAGFGIPFSASTQPVDTTVVNPCYQLEEGIEFTIDPSYLNQPDCQDRIGGKIFVRLRQQVKIINAKIGEGQRAHPNGDCSPSYTGSLRKTGTLPAGVGPYSEPKGIFWESENHKHGDLSNFILINTKAEGRHYYFDVYIDEAEKDKLATDPKYEFIRNCQETGGLVPVVEGPATPTFPPQVISLTDNDFNQNANQKFDVDGFGDNFASYSAELAPYYVRVEEKAIPDPADQIGIFEKTISETTKTYDVFFHAGIAYLKSKEEGSEYMYNPSEELPPFAVSRNPSLQLTAMKFITTSEWTWATPECKPALYLYPKKPTRLRVVLNPAGKLTVTDPPYDEERGWEVVAYPDGKIKPTSNFKLQTSNFFYPYLYYEAQIEKVRTPKKGWVVKKEELESLFNETLPRLGLNQNEAKEFKAYWLFVLNGSPYYFVGVIDQEELERIEPISFSQNPDTFIRVRLFFEPLDQPVLVEPPNLPPTPTRQGFVAVDWGGILSSGNCQGEDSLNAVSR